MRRILPLALALLALGLPASAQNRMDIDRHFTGFDGCFVLYDLKTGAVTRYNSQRSALPRPALATFEIFDALVGLQTGALRDENTTFAWDSTPGQQEAWNHDQTLVSAMKGSVPWYFQEIADLVGPARMQHWLDTVGYGNRSITAGITTFWLNPGSLKISADEQVAFLIRLYKKRLPFDQQTMEIVRRLLVLREENGFVLSGKAAGGHWGDTTFGWFVGHLRTADGDEYVVATNLEGKKDADGPKARAIAEAIFNDLGLTPSKAPEKKKSR